MEERIFSGKERITKKRIGKNFSVEQKESKKFGSFRVHKTSLQKSSCAVRQQIFTLKKFDNTATRCLCCIREFWKKKKNYTTDVTVFIFKILRRKFKTN